MLHIPLKETTLNVRDLYFTRCLVLGQRLATLLLAKMLVKIPAPPVLLGQYLGLWTLQNELLLGAGRFRVEH